MQRRNFDALLLLMFTIGPAAVLLAFTFILSISQRLSFGDDLLIKIEPPEEQLFYCGTMNLPENKVITLEHEGKYLHLENCSPCHSIRKEEKQVGPSLCGSTEAIDKKLFSLLISNDPAMKIPKMNFYKKLVKEYQIDYHAHYKFDFTDSEKNKLRAFIDTITIVQQ